MKIAPQEREEFVMLTQTALNEPDPDKFVDCLLKRNPYIGRLLKIDPQIFGGMAEEYLIRETLILERLEKERRDTIEKWITCQKTKKQSCDIHHIFHSRQHRTFLKKQAKKDLSIPIFVR